MLLRKYSNLFAIYIKTITILVLFFGFNIVGYSQTDNGEASIDPPEYDVKNLISKDDLGLRFPDNVIVYPPPPPPPYIPPGPPKPSDNAKGSLNIGVIHDELRKIYNDCVRDSNNAFDGIDPEPGDTTHDHLSCGSCKLKPRQDWRCGGYRMSFDANFEDILKHRCNSVTMEAQENCVLSEHERIEEEDFFKCENDKEWYVKLPNYFFYNLEFFSIPHISSISRNLYQTAEIRVYCDRQGGWEPGFFERFLGILGFEEAKSGHIKVVQLAPYSRYGGPGLAERIIPTAERRVLNGLKEQYIGKVAKMMHIIDIDGLSGSACSSLGIDGDASVNRANRNIIWDIPSPERASPQ